MTELDLSKLADSTPEQEVQEVEEQKFQHYKSSRISMRMMTTNGKKISFTGYAFITADQDCIDYLDAEIKAGLNVVTKGELLTHKEADPMESLRRKHIEEYKAEEAEKAAMAAKGITRNMGNSKPKEAIAAGVNPLSTAGVAAVAEGSGT